MISSQSDSITFPISAKRSDQIASGLSGRLIE
jgi:hypothetical protein